MPSTVSPTARLALEQLEGRLPPGLLQVLRVHLALVFALLLLRLKAVPFLAVLQVGHCLSLEFRSCHCLSSL